MTTKNKIVFQIDVNFKKYLIKICRSVLLNYSGIPADCEDIYYQFLFTADQVIKKYMPSTGVSFRTFLGLSCKYFAQNYCRSLNSHHYRTMNKYVPLQEGIRYALHDSNPLAYAFDLSNLSIAEVAIYNDYFVDNLNVRQISQKLNATEYFVRKLIRIIKVKLLSQIKN